MLAAMAKRGSKALSLSGEIRVHEKGTEMRYTSKPYMA